MIIDTSLIFAGSIGVSLLYWVIRQEEKNIVYKTVVFKDHLPTDPNFSIEPLTKNYYLVKWEGWI